MNIDTRAKGSRAEIAARDVLRKLTGLQFERVPASGALDARLGMKGDIFLPNQKNRYSIEIKHYAEDHISSKLLTGSDPQLLQFWKQAYKGAIDTGKEPLLIFKYDRSKLFVAFHEIPLSSYKHMYLELEEYDFYVSLLEDWVRGNNPRFIG